LSIFFGVQVSWERGRGTDLCTIVHLALQILQHLITSVPAAVLRGPVGGAIRAPPSGPAPHLLLTLAHYAYFFHSPPLAIAAVKLLAAVAGLSGGEGGRVERGDSLYVNFIYNREMRDDEKVPNFLLSLLLNS
jgi:hypothetical protein